MGRGRKIYCIRHCEREDNENPFWYFNSRLTKDNSPLSERGIKQAQEIARSMGPVRIDYAFSSPYRRTVETASRILSKHMTKLFIEPGLLETESIILGDGVKSCTFETIEDLCKSYPSLIDPMYGPRFESVNHGEIGLFGCKPRVQKTIEHILNLCPSGNILIVAHQSSLATIHNILCPEDRQLKPGQATITKYKERYPYKGQFDCIYECDSSHLTDRSALHGHHYHINQIYTKPTLRRIAAASRVELWIGIDGEITGIPSSAASARMRRRCHRNFHRQATASL
ncbi:histidine phosphatase superfamily (branch 1) domain-containing protein [Ditylenchus destructor]|uniref:Histidine phosphatase superfamily (Branch 1) domain-containing protein n=1 Tax=Ditylenchus destructor TaxID=166010 RepID=A0AAD4RDT1_9BILA|nr:histidine phosphatase superfamily (branch 1) domain-containing protein [Ditylenchus destructor]